MGVVVLPDPDRDQPRTLARAAGRSGEVVIRAAGGALELIVNGVYLMDTRHGGNSERVLARAAAELCARDDPSCLVGGLGFGFTVAELLAERPGATVTCVELEPAVVAHHAGSVDTPSALRVRVGDVFDWLAATSESYDLVLLDVDNGPDWTVRPENARLYDDAGVRLLAERLRPGGVLGVWSARPDPVFAGRLAAAFTRTHEIEVPVDRGVPDVIYLAAR